MVTGKGNRAARRIRSENSPLGSLIGKLVWGDLEYFGDIGKMPCYPTARNEQRESFLQDHFSEVDRSLMFQ